MNVLVFFCNFDPNRITPDPTDDSEAKSSKKKKKKVQTPGAWFNGAAAPHPGSFDWDGLQAIAPRLFTSPNLAKLCAGIAGFHLPKAPVIRAERAFQVATKKAIVKAEGKLPRSIVQFIGAAREAIRHRLGWAEEQPKDGVESIARDIHGTDTKSVMVRGVPRYGALEKEPGAEDFRTSHVFAEYDLSSTSSVMELIDNIEAENIYIDAVHACIPEAMKKPDDLKTAVAQVVDIATAAAEVERRTRMTLKVRNFSMFVLICTSDTFLHAAFVTRLYL